MYYIYKKGWLISIDKINENKGKSYDFSKKVFTSIFQNELVVDASISVFSFALYKI
jgi:hypothetical protein